MIQFALGPKEVRTALSLRTIKRAEQLWRDPSFPGFIDELDGPLVDVDDLKSWWKAKVRAKQSEKQTPSVSYDVNRDARPQTAETESFPEESGGNQAPSDPPGRDFYKTLLLRQNQGGSRGELSVVSASSARN